MDTQQPFCACGCGSIVTSPGKRFIKSHHLGPGNRLLKKYRNEIVSCACGCGAIFKKYNRFGQEREYLKGHHYKGKQGSRWGKGPLAQHRGELVPCACGCGTKIEAYRDGHLYQYVRGHQTKGRPSKRKGTSRKYSTETRLCECGCNTTIRKYDKCGRERRMVSGHWGRIRRGTSIRFTGESTRQRPAIR